jgi:hypothetical protein
MPIRALFRQEFDRVASSQGTLADLTSKAVEWFADDSGTVLGAIAHHQSDLNWSLVVLGLDDQGRFRALYLDFGFWNCDEARQLLFAKMQTAVATGRPVAGPPPSA